MANVRISRRIENGTLTPGTAVRMFCLHCCGDKSNEVRTCDAGSDPKYADCLFHKYRMGRGRVSVKTIRKVCLTCMSNSSIMVEACMETTCTLHQYRFGKNPSCANRRPSDHTLEALREYQKTASH